MKQLSNQWVPFRYQERNVYTDYDKNATVEDRFSLPGIPNEYHDVLITRSRTLHNPYWMGNSSSDKQRSFSAYK